MSMTVRWRGGALALVACCCLLVLAGCVAGRQAAPSAVPAALRSTAENIADLRSSDAVVSFKAAQALVKDPRAVDPLIAALKDRAAARRAAWALGEIKDPRAVEPFIAALRDPDDAVENYAVAGLWALKDPRAVGPLANALKERNLTQWKARREVGRMLTELGWKPQSDQDKVHYWVARADVGELNANWGMTKQVLFRDLSSLRDRVYAAYALIAIGNREAVTELTSLLWGGGGKDLAVVFLNSGCESLEDAARRWASDNGYRILPGGPTPPVSWGRGF
jgi:HEAT repeat protein